MIRQTFPFDYLYNCSPLIHALPNNILRTTLEYPFKCISVGDIIELQHVSPADYSFYAEVLSINAEKTEIQLNGKNLYQIDPVTKLQSEPYITRHIEEGESITDISTCGPDTYSSITRTFTFLSTGANTRDWQNIFISYDFTADIYYKLPPYAGDWLIESGYAPGTPYGQSEFSIYHGGRTTTYSTYSPFLSHISGSFGPEPVAGYKVYSQRASIKYYGRPMAKLVFTMSNISITDSTGRPIETGDNFIYIGLDGSAAVGSEAHYKILRTKPI